MTLHCVVKLSDNCNKGLWYKTQAEAQASYDNLVNDCGYEPNELRIFELDQD